VIRNAKWVGDIGYRDGKEGGQSAKVKVNSTRFSRGIERDWRSGSL
jgi:hypothetical protein